MIKKEETDRIYKVLMKTESFRKGEAQELLDKVSEGDMPIFRNIITGKIRPGMVEIVQLVARNTD